MDLTCPEIPALGVLFKYLFILLEDREEDYRER